MRTWRPRCLHRPPDDESAESQPARHGRSDLAEMLALGLRAPVATWKAFWAALEAPAEDAVRPSPCRCRIRAGRAKRRRG
jgi:hypothetical protein